MFTQIQTPEHPLFSLVSHSLSNNTQILILFVSIILSVSLVLSIFVYVSVVVAFTRFLPCSPHHLAFLSSLLLGGNSVDVVSSHSSIVYEGDKQILNPPRRFFFSPCSVSIVSRCFLIFAHFVLLCFDFTVEVVFFFNLRIFSGDLCWILLCKVMFICYRTIRFMFYVAILFDLCFLDLYDLGFNFEYY